MTDQTALRVRREAQVDERTRRSDALYQLIDQTANDLVATTDLGGVLQEVSAGCRSLLGWEPQDMVGRPALEFVYPEDREAVKRALSASSQLRQTFRARKRDGSFLWVEVNASVVRDQSGRARECLGIVRDIHERKRAEDEYQTLQDQQMLLRMGEKLPRFDDVHSLVQHVASELGTYFDVGRCMFAEIDHPRDVAVVLGEYMRDGRPERTELPLASMAPAVRSELAAGRVVSISDTSSDPRTRDLYPERYGPLAMRAVAGVPLMRHGTWVANYFMTASEVRHWTPREFQMLRVLVERTWLWIDHVRMVHALRASERKYRHFIEATHEGVWEIDAGARTRFANPRMASMLGYSVEEMLGAPLDTFLEAEARALVSVMVARRKAGIHETHDFRFKRKDGSAVWTRLEASSITDENGEYDGALAMVADITEHRQFEADRQFLLELAELLTVAEDRAVTLRVAARRLGEHLAVDRCLFAELDVELERALVTEEWRAPGASSLIGAYPLADFEGNLPEMLKGRSFVSSDAASDARTQAVYERVYGPLGMRAYIAVPLVGAGRLNLALIATSTRPRAWLQREVTLVQSTVERVGLCVERLEHVAALRDMSKELERRVEDRTRALKAALKEKEVLLKEIHHRVKNNLQVISSMLNLQAMHITDDAVQSVFAESQGRVQSIALVHETLYESEDLSSVNFVDYIHTLVNTVIQAQSSPYRNVSTEVEAGDIRLAIGIAIPCGLIINELVTNSLKHAFTGRERGTIRVVLRRRAPERIELAVMDDGVGLPPDLDPRHVTSLGLDLVYTFAEQLGAQVSVKTRPGTQFQFLFRDHD